MTTTAIGYDYKTIEISKTHALLCKDSYQTLGWKLDKQEAVIRKPLWGPLRLLLAPLAMLPGSFLKTYMSEHASFTKEVLYFKRDRAIKDKSTKLNKQVELDQTIFEMEQLDVNKARTASIIGYLIGIFGTICMGFSVFAYLDQEMTRCMVFAIPGFLAWILSYVAYRFLKTKHARRVERKLEEKANKVYQILEK